MFMMAVPAARPFYKITNWKSLFYGTISLKKCLHWIFYLYWIRYGWIKRYNRVTPLLNVLKGSMQYSFWHVSLIHIPVYVICNPTDKWLTLKDNEVIIYYTTLSWIWDEKISMFFFEELKFILFLWFELTSGWNDKQLTTTSTNKTTKVLPAFSTLLFTRGETYIFPFLNLSKRGIKGTTTIENKGYTVSQCMI